MNIQKIIGFVLVAMGLAIIFYSLFASYLIFTGSSEPPELFSAPAQKDEPFSSFAPGSVEELQEQLPQLVGEQLKGLLPQDTVPRVLNFMLWPAFAGLLLFGGSLVAGIGVKLIK